MSKMNPKIKAQWVAALRSGAYVQGTGQLRYESQRYDDRDVLKKQTEFCCLGVLCNLHAQAHPEIAAKETDPDLYMGEEALPPKAVYEWAGLDKDATVTIDGCIDELANHNDNGRSFEEIAKAIQKAL